MSLMPKPFAVLRYLVENPGRLVTHDQLLAAIWPDTYVQPEVLRRYILEIRRALGDSAEAPRFVQTVPKRGYRFIAPVVEVEALATSVPAPTPLTTLVGRTAALSALDACFASAVAGRRQVVFVVGEPGIGKTSLVDAFQRTRPAGVGASVARGQCLEGFGGKEAYYPILEAIGQLARGTRTNLVVDTLASIAPTWLIQLPTLVRPEQQAVLQREMLGATRERMVRELCEAVELVTQTVPMVLILEDLHWVDHATVDVISAMARRREPAKLLLIGTLRPADLILSESPLKTLKQDLLLHRLCHEVTLERLQEPDVADYIAAEFGPGELPKAIAPIIHRHSDGNPLFMTAMLDHLVQQGVLSQAGGRWTTTVPLEDVDPGVPETLKQMLEIQIQYASEGDRQLLKCASVSGLNFTVWAVATMLESDPSTVEEHCHALAERQQFLKFSGIRELRNGKSTMEYQFRHTLYREVLYRRLNSAARVAFHLRLALGLEALHSTVEPDTAAELALHFEEAGESESAIRYLILAAQNATRRCAHREAIAALEHARELLPKIEPTHEQALHLQILEKIGNAYYALGEMSRSAEAYTSMATRAAEAGLLAAHADALLRLPHTPESIPFFLRALELDPTFAAAHVALSRVYSNLGEIARGKDHARLAYEHRDCVGERDRLSISYQYHYEVTGHQQRANETLETWKRRFPLEFQPANALALIYNFLGVFDRAVEEGEEAVRRNPAHGYPYSNLAHAYRGLGRFDDAIRTAERAVALGIETLPTRRLLYQLAVVADDESAAAGHLAWARDKPSEFDIVGAHAQVAGWSGHVTEARRLYDLAATLSDGRNLPDVGNSHLAWAISMEVAYGDIDHAERLARRVLARRPGYDSRLRAAVGLAAARRSEEAAAIADELVQTNPEHTLINGVLAPIVRATVALGRREPARALEHLEAVEPHELGFIAALTPVYLRAQCYLMLGKGLPALEEFQRILDHRGSDPFSPFHAAAPLGLARAFAMIGDEARSLQAYDLFLDAWADADPDVPLLRQARDERARLERRVSSAHVPAGGRCPSGSSANPQP